MLFFGLLYVDRCYPSNFKARWCYPCCNRIIDDLCQGLCNYDSNIFEKTWWKVVRSGSLFFFNLTNTSETVMGISLKASLIFVLALYGVNQMKFLNLIDLIFKAPVIFEKNKENRLAVEYLLVVHLASMLNYQAGGSLVFLVRKIVLIFAK